MQAIEIIFKREKQKLVLITVPLSPSIVILSCLRCATVFEAPMMALEKIIFK